jgi:dnd system-associated protein 4
MTAHGDRRVRRPKAHEELLARLTTDGRPFPQLRDVLVFAAALGWSLEKRKPFSASGESIRWDTATNRPGTELLVDLLGISAHEDDQTLLDAMRDDRLATRITVFEEYVNGGLDEIQRRLDGEIGTPSEILARLVEELTRSTDGSGPPTLDELIDEFS